MRLLPCERERAADVFLPERAEVAPVEHDAALLRVEKAEQQVRDRRLPGAARADESDTLARRQPQLDVLHGGCGRARVARGHILDRHRDRCDRRGGGVGGVSDPGLARRQLEDPPSGRECPHELARGAGERSDRLEGGERQERERGDEHAVERARLVRGHRDGEHDDRREAGDCDRSCVGQARDEPVATGEADELAVGGPDALQGLVLAAVCDELGRSAQQLDELCRQLPASGGLSPAGPSHEPCREKRHRDTAESEADREHERRGRQEERGRDDARDGDDEAGDRRARARGGRAPAGRRRRPPSASAGRRAGRRRARPARAARCAGTRGRGAARARGAPGRGTTAARDTGSADAPVRGSGRRR